MKMNLYISDIKKGILTLMGSILLFATQAQTGKSPLTLADEYFAAGEYYTAAHLYGQYLKPIVKTRSVGDFPLSIKSRRGGTTAVVRNKEEVLAKMAESYRLAHYWQEASSIYQSLASSNPDTYVDGLYWFAVCQRNLGHYDSARQSLEQYIETRSSAKKWEEAAKKEVQTLQYIQQQMTRPDSILYQVKKVDATGSFERGMFALTPYAGGQFLVSSTRADSAVSATENPNKSSLYTASLQGNQLGALSPLNIPAGTPGWNTGAASVSADGQWLYFTQWKKENGQTVSQIWMARKNGVSWGNPELANALNSTGSNSKQPFCSADGKYLYFSSDRKNGKGGFDIWVAALDAQGKPGTPINAGAMVNTPGDEIAPYYQSSSTTLVYSSNGKGGMGGFDLFSVEGKENEWIHPLNLGHPVNSSRDDIYFYAAENQSILARALVGSDRGTGCCLETYQVTKKPKTQSMSGTILDCKTGSPLADVEVILKQNGKAIAQTTTNDQGQYRFQMEGESAKGLSVQLKKVEFSDTTQSLITSTIDETDLLADRIAFEPGCIAAIEPPPVEKLVIRVEDVVTVYFDFDKHNLKSPAVAKLDSIYTVLLENPGATIQISGYTDGLGTEDYNKVLSDKRARACANYLIQKGIDPVRISFVSFGACCPVEMELLNGRDNPDGRSKNRRALINVKKY